MSEISRKHFKVAIVGSGFAGLGTAIRLKQEGEDDFVILERASDVGGTWRDNTYPGCACDVESHLYSFSFAPNPHWSQCFSGQREILQYLRDCALRFELTPHLRFRHEVKECRWDSDAQVWRISTSAGNLSADVLVGGFGFFTQPSLPELPGLSKFEGKVFHSARWDHEHDLTGRSVAVVGTGASAVQFIPQIQPRVGKLRVFQRTAPWVLPKTSGLFTPTVLAARVASRKVEPSAAARGEPARYRAHPLLQRLARGFMYLYRELLVVGFRNPPVMRLLELLSVIYMRFCIPDAALRAKLRPGYRLGCKRVLLSDDYFPALAKSNVEVVTDSISEVRERSIVTSDGREHPVDTLIFGTGFMVTHSAPYAKQITGAQGKTLAEVWDGSPSAHVCTTVNGFPNLFILFGPNTGLGHTTIIHVIETQIEHLIRALRYMKEKNLSAVEPRSEAQSAFVAKVDDRMQGTVWTAGGCASYYLDATGRNSSLWPDTTVAFRRRVAPFDPAEYVCHARTQLRAQPDSEIRLSRRTATSEPRSASAAS